MRRATGVLIMFYFLIRLCLYGVANLSKLYTHDLLLFYVYVTPQKTFSSKKNAYKDFSPTG